MRNKNVKYRIGDIFLDFALLYPTYDLETQKNEISPLVPVHRQRPETLRGSVS